MNKPDAKIAQPETNPAQHTSGGDETARDPLVAALKAMLANGSVPVPPAPMNRVDKPAPGSK